MSKIAKLQNHPAYNPLFDSHPETSNIFNKGLYKSYNFQLRVDELNKLYKEIGFPFHVTFTETYGPRWQGKLYQLEFTRTEPIPNDFSEMGYYMPRGLQALDKIDIVRYLEHMHYYATYLYHFLSDKYRKSLPFSPELKNDMPF